MAAWLDLVSEATGWTLVDTGRLESLVQGMSHPESQYPSLLYFAGNASRVKALQALFPHNNITRRGPAGFTRLHLSTETANSQHPVLFAEGSLRRDSGQGESSLCPWPTEKLQIYPIVPSRKSTIADIQCHVLSKLILPWTQVLCYFVDTTADLYKIRQLLTIPRRKARIGSQPIPDFLRVIVVLIGNQQDADYNAAFKELVLYSEMETELDVTFMDLRKRHELSPAAAFEPLRRAILDHTSAIQKQQIDQGFAYSAQHICKFWRRTLELEMRRLEDSSLDCLGVARENDELNSVKTDHIVSFLQETSDSECDKNDIHAFIASALLMNAYPPNMHPYVFSELYEHQLLEAWRAQANAHPGTSSDAVLTYMKHFFDQMSPRNPSAIIRKAALAKYFHRYGGLYSTTSCFLCLCRHPEHMMPCHHAICDTCAVIFGRPSRSAEYHFDIEECPLCLQSFDLTIRQLPPTKRPVILSLDGGGIRGIVQLGLLRSLERRLGGGIPLPHVFDLSMGTSVGAINLMDLVFNKASAEQSFQRFPQFAQEIFGSTSAFKELSIFKYFSWVGYIVGFLADCQYDGKNLEEILKKALGLNRRMFDVGTTPCTDCRVAVITSRTSDGKACLLANYRGVGVRCNESAYQFLLPQGHDQNPLLWETPSGHSYPSIDSFGP
ncbi:uncharacterized protein N7484_008194 [Penicillium longicatenatum]|uniref:uncharacterized protein n=1 Tax=Penicillium longicatenatum TaxID=1561947 RepID=UPI0025487094|nr:uncharacterized protein N7484_008194 [Penicillium longicatenatum]KAJ5640332.1 hypothetical protein N7484_008194 [Penicillium longicatenatum]